MRWLHVIVVALFVIATCIFAIQNFEIVTLSFLGFSARAPLALLIAIFYLLGMAAYAAGGRHQEGGGLGSLQQPAPVNSVSISAPERAEGDERHGLG